MRSKKLLMALLAATVAFLTSFGCVGCVATGFGMTADMGAVAFWCGAAALVSSILFLWPLDLVPLCGVAATGVYLWFAGGMKLSFQAVIYRISRKYNARYGWGVIRPLHYTAEMLAPETGLFLCFVGAVLAVFVAWAFSRRKLALPAILLTMATVGSCFLVRETVPDPIWLWLFLFGILLLILTQTARRVDLVRGNRLAAMAAVPLAVFLLLLFAFIPKNNYSADKPAQMVTNAVLENRLFQAVFGDLTKKPGEVTVVNADVVNLENVGPQHKTQDEVLWVETDFSGRIYLRCRSFDLYDGVSWEQSGDRMTFAQWPETDTLESLGTLSVSTRFAHKMTYVPYYVQNMPANAMGYTDNVRELTEYTYSVYKPLSESQMAEIKTPLQNINSGYELQDWHYNLAYKIANDKKTVYEKAQAIADYVRNSAEYDLLTQKVPQWEDDFVRWFLQRSDTGYCVHFASATTVLLQAAGIPARYVNGYVVDVRAGENTTVYTSDAHAWAEYWLPGYGWTVLESTPAERTEDPGAVTEQQKETIGGGVVAIVVAAILLTAFTAVFVQRWVRLCLRRKKLHSGTLKRQALAYWQEAVRFANCLEEAPAAGLLEIAERAKFSNHPITEEDLEPFRVYLNSAKQRICNHSLLKKLYYRFVLALY